MRRNLALAVVTLAVACAVNPGERDGDFELIDDNFTHSESGYDNPIVTSGDPNVCEPIAAVVECRELFGEVIPDGGDPIESTCLNLELGCCNSDYYMSEDVANCVLDNDDRFDKIDRVAYLKNDSHTAEPVWELWQEFGSVDFQGVGIHAQTGATLWFEDIEGCTG